MTSRIFINQPTVIDHSYIDKDGLIIGGSINPSFVLSGEPTADESVVCDFSTAKSQIKKLIDHNDFGFDHKCWIIGGLSNITSITASSLEFNPNEVNDQTTWDWLISDADPERTITVSTPNVVITGPKNSFCFFKAEDNTKNVYDAAIAAIQKMLNERIVGIDIEVVYKANLVTCEDNSSTILFHYVHGLKNSSAWGCQNIAHGHTSFIEFIFDEQKNNPFEVANTDGAQDESLLRSIQLDLDHTIFISADNLLEVTAGESTSDIITYTSNDRGRFSMSFPRGSTHKTVVLETETTIEYIVEYIAANYETELQTLRVKTIHVSEGLDKGASINL